MSIWRKVLFGPPARPPVRRPELLVAPAVPPPLSMERLIRDYAAFLEQHPHNPTRIEDATVLPHRKELILDALFAAMEQSQPDRVQKFLCLAAVSLAQFQYQVGPEPLEQFGLNISTMPRTKDVTIWREYMKRSAEAQRRTEDDFREFDKLVKDDVEFILRKISAAESKRPR